MQSIYALGTRPSVPQSTDDAPEAAQAVRSDVAECCDRRLPSFLIVGPPRTGTTWLYEVLSRQSNLPCPTKETRFFDLHFHRGWRWYLDHFPRTHPGQPFGEVAPTYFASSAARDRIAESLSGVKVIVTFRHPVHRLVSLYRLKRAYGMVGWSLETALERDPELLGSSRYATLLQQWQARFPKEQLSVNLYDDLSDDPQSFIDRIVDFAGISRFRLHPSQMSQVFSSTQLTEPRSYLATRAATAMADWCKARRLDNVVASVRNSSLIKLFLGGGDPFPAIPADTMEKISALVRPEIDQLEEMLGRDLSGWKTYSAA
jgi:hypothetical protein